jgi:hypothetical protein
LSRLQIIKPEIFLIISHGLAYFTQSSETISNKVS